MTDKELIRKLNKAQKSLIDLVHAIESHDDLKDDHIARYEADQFMDEFNDLFEYLDTHPHLKRASRTQPLRTRGDYGEDYPETLPPVEEEDDQKEALSERVARKFKSSG